MTTLLHKSDQTNIKVINGKNYRISRISECLLDDGTNEICYSLTNVIYNNDDTMDLLMVKNTPYIFESFNNSRIESFGEYDRVVYTDEFINFLFERTIK